MAKLCHQCGEEKPDDGFAKDASRYDGLQSYCRVCSAAEAKDWHRRNKEQANAASRAYYAANKEQIAARVKAHREDNPDHVAERYRKSRLKLQYGLSREEYNALLEKQGGVCAICGSPPNGRELAVDHNHTTGEVRGILCHLCNQAIGQFRDREDLLLRAAAYLRGEVRYRTVG